MNDDAGVAELYVEEEDMERLAKALSWMVEDLNILRESQEDGWVPDDEPSPELLEAEIQSVHDLHEYLMDRIERTAKAKESLDVKDG
jgi:hypothetical protein